MTPPTEPFSAASHHDRPVEDFVADFNLEHKALYCEEMGALRCPSCGATGITTQPEAIRHALRKDGSRGCTT